MRRRQKCFSFLLSLAFAVGGASIAFAQTSTDFGASNTTRINAGHFTGAVQADAASGAASMSDNGRFIAFESVATNLIDESLVTGGVTDGRRHIYLYDRQAGTVEIVSIADVLSDNSNQEFSADTFEPAVSNDGRYIAFASSAAPKTVIEASEVQGNPAGQVGPSSGQHVHYVVPGRHIYVRDRLANRTFLASQVGVDALRQTPPGETEPESPDDDCEVDLRPLMEDLPYEYRMSAAVLSTTSPYKRGMGSASSSNPRFSADGNYLIFETNANNLVLSDSCTLETRIPTSVVITPTPVPGALPTPTSDTTSFSDVQSVIAAQISAGTWDEENYLINRDCNRPVLSDSKGTSGFGNGILLGDILYGSGSTILPQLNRALGCYVDSNSVQDIVARQGASNKNGMVSMFCKYFEPGADCVPLQASSDVNSPDISSDGTYAVFSTQSPFLALDDNKTDDVFLVERKAVLNDDGTQPLVEVSNLIRVSNGLNKIRAANGTSTNPVVTGNGRFVVYQSTATDIINGDTNGVSDIYLYDSSFGDQIICSKLADGTLGNGASVNPAVSGDGSFITFESTSTNLGVNNGQTNVYLAKTSFAADGSGRLADCVVDAVVSYGTGSGGNGASGSSDVGITLKTQSGDGVTVRVKQAVVAYQTDATDLASDADTNSATDVHQSPNCSATDLATDTDGDGTPDCFDQCYKDRSKVEDSDTDGDGVADCEDACKTDPLKTVPLSCGCGVSETDLDGDGTPDCNDECPNDPDKTAPGSCGCGVPDLDLDEDDVIDCLEEEPPLAGATPTPVATSTPVAAVTPDAGSPTVTDAPPMPRLVRVRVNRRRTRGSAILSSTADTTEAASTFRFRIRNLKTDATTTIDSDRAQIVFRRLQVGAQYGVSYAVITSGATTSFSRERTFRIRRRRAKRRGNVRRRRRR